LKTLLLTIVILGSISFTQSAKASDHSIVQNLETCFSPEGHCDKKLIEVMSSAKKTLDVAIYEIEHGGIGSAITAAKNRGVTVRVVADKRESLKKKSQVPVLLKAKVPLKIANVKGIMHNKFCIVDGVILETGSFNYKKNASEANAENQIYITDPGTVKKYQDVFNQLWTDGLVSN